MIDPEPPPPHAPAGRDRKGRPWRLPATLARLGARGVFDPVAPADGSGFLSYGTGSVPGVEEALATLDEVMDRCLSVPLAARSSEQLLGYLGRLHAHQQRLAAMQAAVIRELEVLGVPGARVA